MTEEEEVTKGKDKDHACPSSGPDTQVPVGGERLSPRPDVHPPTVPPSQTTRRPPVASAGTPADGKMDMLASDIS